MMRSMAALALAGLMAGALPGALRAETGKMFVLPMAADPASKQISVTVNPGLKRTVDLPAGPLREARVAMLAGTDIAPDTLRALADRRDGLAAQRYVRYLTAHGGSDSDVAYYGSIAAITGRIATFSDAVEAMTRLNPATEPPERIKVYIEMIYPHAWAGNALALDTIAALTGEGRLFGPMSEKTRAKMLDQSAKVGDGRLELLMAMELMRDPASRKAAEPQIRSYLKRAAAGNHLGVRSAAGALLSSLDSKTTTSTGANP